MTYQKIKDLLADKSTKLTSEFLKNEIDQVLKTESSAMTQLVEDMIYLYLENSSNAEISSIISKGFYHLFVQGLTWGELQKMKISTKPGGIEKKELFDLKLSSISDLLQKPFQGHFIHEFSQDPIAFRKMAFKIFGSGFCTNDKLEIIGERLNLPQNKEIFEELLLATRSFSQLNQVASVFKVDPFIIINKSSDIQTLYPTYVWQMENAHISKEQHTPYTEKQRIFMTGLDTIRTVQTEKTSNLDFKSRIVWASCNLNNEHNYADFLRDLEITDVNLNCVDYFRKSEPVTLKERLLKFGKIKLVNKFEKSENVEVNLGKVITAVPNKAYLISNKKGFLKQFIKNLNEDIDYTQILVDVLETKYKQFSNSPFSVKCYLPVKAEYLDKPASYWKANKVSSEQREFIDIDEFSRENATKSFVNLVSWIGNKNINWTEKTKTGNSVIGESIITSMQFTIEYNPDTIKLSRPEHTLALAYKNLPNEYKKQVLNEIKNNWVKIWDEPTSQLHESYILNTPFKKNSNVFLFLHQCMKVCIESGVNFEPSFFDEKWNNIKEVFVKYQGDDEVAKKFLILENAAELQSTLVNKEEPKTPIKPKKI